MALQVNELKKEKNKVVTWLQLFPKTFFVEF